MEGILDKPGTNVPTLPNVPYPEVPLCGTSIGPVVPSPEESSSGTLGAYVTINGPQKGRYALTNDHVCFTQFRPRPCKLINSELGAFDFVNITCR